MFLKKRSLAILLCIALSVSLIAGLSSGQEVSADSGPDLFFSEYVEGSTVNNKALEIYNPKIESVDLADYKVKVFKDGAGKDDPSETYTLAGTLDGGGVYILIRNILNQNLGLVASTKRIIDVKALDFNGNDAVVLCKDGVAIDRIGKVGENPGQGGWGDGDVRTIGRTLVRKPHITKGNSHTDAAFDPVEEWISVGKDNFSYLGDHPHAPQYTVTFGTGTKGSFLATGPAASQALLDEQSAVTPTLEPYEAYLALGWNKDYRRITENKMIEAVYGDRDKPGLFFSKYVEGSSNNKAVEIYNPTDETINLKDYVIKIFFDGKPEASGNQIPLSAVDLPPGGSYVIANTSAGEILKSLADRSHGHLSFNGNDVVVLVDPDNIIVDMIGKIGEGSDEVISSSFTHEMIVGWYSGKVQTGNRTLVRKPWVTEGLDTRELPIFDPSLQWEVHPQDTFDVLGSHVCYPTRTLSFDCAGGEPIPSIEKNYGTPIDEPAAPKRTGYEFLGWDQEFPEAMPTANLTLTANWRGLPYTMNFDSAGGTEVAPITLGAGTLVQPPADPVRTGHRFLGWEPALPETMPVDGGSYTALWEVSHYTITFDSQGGSPVASIMQAYGSPIDPPADPVREGYDFLGWEPGLPDRMPDGDIRVKALWGLQVLVDGGEDKVPATGERSMILPALVFMGLALGLALVIARRSRVGRA